MPKTASISLLLDSTLLIRGKIWLFRRQLPKLMWTETPILPCPCLPWWDWVLTVGGRVGSFFGKFVFFSTTAQSDLKITTDYFRSWLYVFGFFSWWMSNLGHIWNLGVKIQEKTHECLNYVEHLHNITWFWDEGINQYLHIFTNQNEYSKPHKSVPNIHRGHLIPVK